MKLEALKKLCDEATPGPWVHDDGQVGPCSENGDFAKHKEINSTDPKYDRLSVCWTSDPIQYGCECGKYDSDKDGEFIAAARTYLPKLIAVAEEATNWLRADPDSIEEHDAMIRMGLTLSALKDE